ncbi:Haloalkane dehalogenase [Seminavis robusta]|uniref:Haloalkane dehalogenase n=1 Tax=Seminavis robusta TaxID=568900 RepID=A0A9N8EIM2_9STRA|nr:Haloalkane dehalogenase [Seminavis robusta]|eukprot:Sro994_g229080.1 Haloalkane dehalogenase (379) ;mRNA; f:31182-32318
MGIAAFLSMEASLRDSPRTPGEMSSEKDSSDTPSPDPTANEPGDILTVDPIICSVPDPSPMCCGCCVPHAWTTPKETPALVAEHERQGRRIALKDGSSVFVRDETPQDSVKMTVVMVHGVPASSFLYRKFFAPLVAEGYRAIAFDLPGLGLSDKPLDRDYSWPAMAETLHEIMGHEDLAINTKIHMVIHDIGGPISALYAADHPERVESITALDTLLDIASFSPPFPMFFFPIPIIGNIAIASMTPWVLRQFMYLRGVADTEACDHEEAMAWVFLLKRQKGAASFSKIMKSFPSGKSKKQELTNKIQQALGTEQQLPMQVIWAQGEVAIPQSQCEYIREKFHVTGDTQHVPGRHFFQLESAETIVQHIHQFLQERQQQ